MASPAIRPVASPEELAVAFDAAGAQLTPPLDRGDRRCRELLARFPRTSR